MLKTEEEKKSFGITLGLFLALFMLLFFFGLSYLDLATEQGIAVNFGTSDTGSGKVQPTAPVKTAPSNTNKVEEAENTPPEEASSTNSEIKEEVITQKSEEAPVIESSKKKEKKPISKEKTETKKNTENSESKKEAPKKVIEKKPDASTKSALDSFLNGPKQDGETNQGEGNDTSGGDKGKPDGDPNAKSYYGNGKGLDGDGNYRLGGRKALNKERKIPNCNETGIVVVKIVVNREGKVIQATPGIKGSTNTATCLMQPAKAAALATKFNSDPKAPFKQIGSIRYNFKVTE